MELYKDEHDRLNKQKKFICTFWASQQSIVGEKCAILTPPFGHSKHTYMDKAVVATRNGKQSTHGWRSTSGLACSEPIAEGMDESAPKCQHNHLGLRE